MVSKECVDEKIEVMKDRLKEWFNYSIDDITNNINFKLLMAVLVSLLLSSSVLSYIWISKDFNSSEWKCSKWSEVSREKLFSETEPTGKGIESVQCEKYGMVEKEYCYVVASCIGSGCDYREKCAEWKTYEEEGCEIFSYEKVQKKCV